MNIQVSQIKAGDYVVGFGTVNKVRVFYKEKAIRGKQGGAVNRKFVPLPDNKAYARLIAEQQENSYDREIDTVVVYGAACSKAFSADKTVDVYRISRVAV
jgi:hypothetical protein